MASLAEGLTRAWFERRAWLWLLWPLSLLFGLVVGCRALLLRLGLMGAKSSPLPVIVVGNLTVGGSGKSPLVTYLVAAFQARAIKVGVVSRGYGSTLAKGELREVACTDAPQDAGDEPLMLKRRLNCPVVICGERAKAVAYLQTLGCELVISDDGLQHYAMARALELCVVDGRRGFGNARLLPMGPLRESLGRLRCVDHVVVNGELSSALEATLRSYNLALMKMSLRSRRLRRLDGLAEIELAAPEAANELLAHFAGKELHAVAAIGHPQRFFDTLQDLGLNCHVHAFPDHHAYSVRDFRFLDLAETSAAVLMTEKDAVKCRSLSLPDAWELLIDAHLEGQLAGKILEQLALKGYHFRSHAHKTDEF